MTTYYVATLARYVLVEAADEYDARARGYRALEKLHGDRQSLIEIKTVRPATDAEIELGQWHDNMVAREAANKAK